jgi:hypothetical protein
MGRRVAVCIAVFASGWPGLVGGGAAPEEAAVEQCLSAAKATYGVEARRAGCTGKKCVPTPRYTRRAEPALPSPLPAACSGTESVHQVLIAPDGSVGRVWTVRAGCPELDRAMETAISHSKYETTVVNGAAIAVCSTMHMKLAGRPASAPAR